MKTTFKSSEIAHIWAHQSAPHGTSPGAMSFNGPAFLSYGTEIARHITHGGKSAVILNDTHYNVSTSKHQGCVRSALPGGVPVFHIGGTIGRGCSLFFDNAGRILFEYAIEEAAQAQKRADGARSAKDRHLSEVSNWLSRAKEVNEFFGLRRKVDEQIIQRATAAKAREEKRLAKERGERELKYRAELEREPAIRQLHLDAWLAGSESLITEGLKSVPVSTSGFHDLPEWIRIRDYALYKTTSVK